MLLKQICPHYSWISMLPTTFGKDLGVHPFGDAYEGSETLLNKVLSDDN